MKKGPVMNRVPPPPPGIYFGVPFHEYNEWEAINFSALKWARVSMADVREHLDEAEKTSDQMAFGTLLHAAMLEPERLPSLMIPPPPKPNGEIYKTRDAQGVKDYQAKHPGKIIAWDDDVQAIRRIRANMLKHPEISAMMEQRISGGRDCNVEVSFTWVDPETGVRCKARADMIIWPKGSKAGTRVDFKSCADPTPDGFARSIGEYGYHIQDHMQEEGLRILGRENVPGQWFAIQNSAPYKIAAYYPTTEVDTLMRGYAAKEYRGALNDYAMCLRTGEWPGLPTGVRPIDLRVYYSSRYTGGPSHN